MEKGAKISDCGKYRYLLWRIWDETKPKALFIMLNPSTADDKVDDPTIRKCIGFCKRWGFGGFYVGNLHPYRTKSPNELFEYIETANMAGPSKTGQQVVSDISNHCQIAVMAWGNHFFNDDDIFENSYRRIVGYLPMVCLGKTKGGYPRHPLYVPYNTQLLTWPEGQPTTIQ